MILSGFREERDYEIKLFRASQYDEATWVLAIRTLDTGETDEENIKKNGNGGIVAIKSSLLRSERRLCESGVRGRPP